MKFKTKQNNAGFYTVEESKIKHTINMKEFLANKK